MFGFFGGSVFGPKNIPDLSGKVIIITGANGGLGLASLLLLAPHNPSRIYLCARCEKKFNTAMADIAAAVPDAAEFVKFLELDLSSLASVKAAARAFLKENSRLDILMNNAGVMALPPGLTQDGYEIQFGINHLGHFLFTKELLPVLQATARSSPTADVRIIHISSMGHQFAPRNGGFISSICRTDMAEYSTWIRYGQSKLANILFTNQLATRYPEITSVSVHPGKVATNLAASLASEYSVFFKILRPFLLCIVKSPGVGALNQTWAATAMIKGKDCGKTGGVGYPEVEQGSYYTPVGMKTSPSAFARDEKTANELWEWSEKEVKRHGF